MYKNLNFFTDYGNTTNLLDLLMAVINFGLWRIYSTWSPVQLSRTVNLI